MLNFELFDSVAAKSFQNVDLRFEENVILFPA